MKKRSLVFGLGIACLLMLMTFTFVVPAVAQSPEGTKSKITVLGGTKGGVGFVVLEALGHAITKSDPNLSMEFVEGGFVDNISKMNAGAAGIGSTTLSLCKLASEGKPPFTDPMPNLRSMFLAQDNIYIFAVVRKDLPASSISDIVQKKLPVKLGTLAAGSGTELTWRTAFESQGVTWDMIKGWGGDVVFGPWAENVKRVQDGELDGILAIGVLKIKWVEELCAKKGMKILKWDKDILDTLKEKLSLGRDVIPMGTYYGVDYNVIAPVDTSEILVSKDLKDDVVYSLLKALDENADQYRKEYPALSTFKAENMAAGIALPLHSGALKYYKEKGYLN